MGTSPWERMTVGQIFFAVVQENSRGPAARLSRPDEGAPFSFKSLKVSKSFQPDPRTGDKGPQYA
jgi:hypothetical protein